MKFTRAKLEDLVLPAIQKCKKPIEQAFSDGKLTAKDIDRIILVGGPTRMPIVQKFVEDIAGKIGERRRSDGMRCDGSRSTGRGFDGRHKGRSSP
jgi:molecular chaperone DnaK